jgi:alpha-mannosidase
MAKTKGMKTYSARLLGQHHRVWCVLGIFSCFLLARFCFGAEGGGGQMLWQIGKPDHNDAEFALAPNGYAQFQRDGFFAVGESDAKRDWPYVHPGPHDGWAGGREHTYTILFGLGKTPEAGECRLKVDLLDTQNQSPPTVRFQVNGQVFERALPKGAGDDSVNGQPAKGKEHRVEVPFPATLLKAGDNQIRITTLTGSWLLYDWLGLETPAGAELAGVQAHTLVDRIQPVRALKGTEGHFLQPVLVTLMHFGGEADGILQIEGGEPMAVHLKSGEQSIEGFVPAVSAEARRKVVLEIGGKALAEQSVTVKPATKLTVYILPHSHTDIGYTEIQTAIE